MGSTFSAEAPVAACAHCGAARPSQWHTFCKNCGEAYVKPRTWRDDMQAVAASKVDGGGTPTAWKQSTHAPSVRRCTLLDDFAAQARAQPSSPALHYVDGAESLVLTYAQLISEAQAVARGLVLAGCIAGARVADFCDEGPAIVLALLGIALAGGVVVPLDPALPAARLRSLLADADVSLLLCSAASVAALSAKLETSRTPLLALEAVGAAGDAPLPTPTPDALVHLIYTSGSTGAPKAVAVEHGALRAYGWAKVEAHAIRAGCTRCLLVSAHTWDPCIGDVFSTLAAGATLCVVPRAQLLQDLAGALRATRASHVCATPSLWALLRPGVALDDLEVVALGGEALPRRLVASSCGAPNAAVHNTYGVTEAAVYQTIGRAEPTGAAAMCAAGAPLPGIALALAPVAAAEAEGAGEILVGGAQLARGYWRRDALTADRFVWLSGDEVRVVAEGRAVRYPEGACGEDDGEPTGGGERRRRRWFRTGDLGSWSEAEGLHVLGRLDAQVKLRGQRIELGEIESCALAVSGVEEAACVVQERASSA